MWSDNQKSDNDRAACDWGLSEKKWFNQKERRERTWAYIANKRKNSFIKESQEKGAYHDEIGTAAVEFYSDWFSKGTSIPNSPLLDAIPVLVDANMNLSLCCIPRKKYVIDIVESIDVDSSPGPDAFFFMNTIW